MFLKCKEEGAKNKEEGTGERKKNE